MQNNSSKIFFAVLSSWFLFVLFVIILPDRNKNNFKDLEKIEGKLVDVYVFEDKESRYLAFQKSGSTNKIFEGIQTIQSKKNPKVPASDYIKIMSYAPSLVKNPKNILQIGVGGGSLPSFLQKFYPDSKITGIEINKDVIKLAKKYFYLKPNKNLNIIIDDGRKFLRKNTQKFDIIYLDAYSHTTNIPTHLITNEFFKLVKKRLNKNGVIAINIVLKPNINDEYFRRIIETLKNNFQNLFGYKVSKSGSGNIVIFGFKTDKKISIKSAENNFKKIAKEKNYNFKELPQNYNILDLKSIKEEMIYTDDNATIVKF